MLPDFKGMGVGKEQWKQKQQGDEALSEWASQKGGAEREEQEMGMDWSLTSCSSHKENLSSE